MMGVEISAGKLKNNRMKSRVPEVNKPIYNCLLISFFFLSSAVLLNILFFTESDSSESEMLFILRSI